MSEERINELVEARKKAFIDGGLKTIENMKNGLFCNNDCKAYANDFPCEDKITFCERSLEVHDEVIRKNAIDDFLEMLYFVFDVKEANKNKINEIAEQIKEQNVSDTNVGEIGETNE